MADHHDPVHRQEDVFPRCLLTVAADEAVSDIEEGLALEPVEYSFEADLEVVVDDPFGTYSGENVVVVTENVLSAAVVF